MFKKNPKNIFFFFFVGTEKIFGVQKGIVLKYIKLYHRYKLVHDGVEERFSF